MAVEDTQPLISHLIELRKRLLNAIICILVVFLALVYFANDIYQLVASPLIKQMPMGASMIATDVASPFFTPIKLTMIVSVFLSAPFILYQVWAFVAPALYKHERRLMMPLLFQALRYSIWAWHLRISWCSRWRLLSLRKPRRLAYRLLPTLTTISIS